MNLNTIDRILGLIAAGLLAWMTLGLARTFAGQKLSPVWNAIPGDQSWAVWIVAALMALVVFIVFEGVRPITWVKSKIK